MAILLNQFQNKSFIIMNTFFRFEYSSYLPALFIAAFLLPFNATPGNGKTTFPSNTGAVAADQIYTRPSGDVTFFIYPNPNTDGNLMVKFKNASTGTVRAAVYNLIGNEVFSTSLALTQDGGFTTGIHLPDALPKGKYMLQIGTKSETCTKLFYLLRNN